MSRRWVRWSGGGLLVAFLALVGWRLSLEIPERLRKAERELVASAARVGLDVRYGAVKIHLLRLHLSMDRLEVRDALADLPLAGAGSVDVSISPLRLLMGESPVSRVRVRNFRLEAGEQNRALYTKLSSMKGEPGGILPEILLVDGSILLGPLGPVRRFEASVRELRIREVRFFGTRVSASVSRAAGEIVVPGGEKASWPYPSLEADLQYKGGVWRVRRARAWGDASTVKFSGFVDTGKRTADGKASGEVDLARWIAAGGPGFSYARNAVRGGRVEFSASAAGPWDNPEGKAKLLLRQADLQGAPATDGDAELSVGNRVLRLDRVRARLWGGILEASGSYGIQSRRAEGKASLRRASLAAAPWESIGAFGAISGTADLGIQVSGAAGRWKGTATLSLPEGLERLPSPDRRRLALRFPIAADVSAALSEGNEVRLDAFRLQAGRAEIRGEGVCSPAGKTVRLNGSMLFPSGKASEYGWMYPLAWESLAGEWEVSGPLDRLRTTVSLKASSLAARSLPPLPLTLKVDGIPADALHFVADIPAPSFKVTAVGTVARPLSFTEARADLSITAREIDLKESPRWASAVAASLGRDAAPFLRYLEGVEGTAEADGRIALSPGTASLSGTFRSARLDLRGVPFASVKVEGEYGSADSPQRWTARGEGRLAEGVVHVSAKGGEREGLEVSGEVEGLEGSSLPVLMKRENLRGVRGLLNARFKATLGPRGWELPQVSAESGELSMGSVRFSGVRAEGALGPDSGTLSVRSASPRISLSGEVQRGGGWPAKFAVSADALPTSFFLAAAGRPEVASGGSWSAEAGGVVRLADLAGGKPLSPEAFPTMHLSVHGRNPSVGDVHFQECRASGRRQGDALEGEFLTLDPDTRLSWKASLREPFGFLVEGPFSFGEGPSAAPKEGSRRFAVLGRTRVEGALRAIEKTTGTIQVDSFAYRDGGLELSGKDLSARMDPEGIRWTGGSLVAAGSPVRIAGKVSWKGELDLRLEGKLPAGAIRFAVPGVFDRLDGVVTLEARVTGNRNDPSIVGTGHLEGGTLSFLGYAQLFEGLRADAVISREKIVFEHFEGKSGGGYVDGWGEVPLKMDAGQRMYFSVDFFDLRFPYPEEFRPVLRGHAELFGPVDDLMVTGDVEIQSAKYTKTLRLEKALVDFGRRLADVTARRERSAFRVRLDINAIADGTIRIKNNLADAQAKGEFKIVGDSSRVILLGSFDATEGYVEYRGNRYELKRATVDFQDPRKNNPRIDGRAETRKGNVTVTVAVTGTLEKYEVDLFSDPPLGKNDLVALLSLGVTTHSLVGQEGTVGSAAAASIALGPYKGGVEEGIRGAIGLDRFAIEPGFSSATKTIEPRFIVGKSFGDRASVAVSTSVGATAESSALGEVKLREHIFLQGAWESGTTSKEGDLGADLKFRYRYRQWKDFLRGKE